MPAPAAATTTAAASTPEPDEILVQALYKMGISSNRARRACVATRNASREAALAWCVEHAADPAMDAPFVSRSRPAGNGGSGGSGGGDGGDGVTGQRTGHEMRAAARRRGVAAAALEAYVRARLSVVGGSVGSGGGGGGGGNVDGGGVGGGHAGAGVPSEEMAELVAVLASFRKQQSLGQAEDKARAILPASVDLGMFAEDQRYRQVRVRLCPRQCCCMGVALSAARRFGAGTELLFHCFFRPTF